MALDTYNEASTFTIRTAFFGITRIAQVPQSVRYRIVDLTNERIVRDWTDLQPDFSVDIQIVASDNEIYDDSMKKAKRFKVEERALVVQANYDTDDQYPDEYRYLIRNLRGFDS